MQDILIKYFSSDGNCNIDSCLLPLLMPPTHRYLQRLTEKLTQDLKLSQKASRQLLETECKREQTSASLKLLQPRYSNLVTRTKALQAQVGEGWHSGRGGTVGGEMEIVGGREGGVAGWDGQLQTSMSRR